MAYFDTGRASIQRRHRDESIHSRIARGFRNRDNYRIRMLLIRSAADSPPTPRV